MTTRAILDEENIPYKDVTFCGRRSKVDPERELLPTVLIITNHCLRPVAKKIQRALERSFHGICAGEDQGLGWSFARVGEFRD